MPEYSPGPFMRMSPTGLPGLLIAIAVVAGVASLFRPEAVILVGGGILVAGVLFAFVLRRFHSRSSSETHRRIV